MPLHLEQRDLQLLAEIGELGLLDIELIHARYWPDAKTKRASQKRLKLLTEHGLVKPARLEVTYRTARVPRPTDGKDTALKKPPKSGGRLPTIYCLTEQGAEALEMATGQRPLRVSRSDPKPLTLFHRSEVVRARLAIDDACRLRSLPAPAWIMEQDTHPGMSPNEPLSRRLILQQHFGQGHARVSCRPDASCLLRLPSRSADRSFDELIAYLELDRSTNKHQIEIDKLAGYHCLLKEQAYRRHWPETQRPTVRVLYVCPSHERVNNLAASFAGQPVAEYVRFAVLDDLVPERALSDAIWQTTGGELRAILPADCAT
jgi:hypothetical protein